jgi:hypothetical protein
MIFCNILYSLLCTNVYGDTGCFFYGSLTLDDLNPSIYIFSTSYMIGSIEMVDYLETGWICLLVFTRRLNSGILSNWWKCFSALFFTIAGVVGG